VGIHGFTLHPFLKRFKMLNVYEIRSGNGNDGEYYRGVIAADDAFEALRKASRSRMIWKPKAVTLDTMEGDDQSAYLADYRPSQEVFGACGWCASATLTKASA
jgi:hypothetical protein